MKNTVSSMINMMNDSVLDHSSILKKAWTADFLHRTRLHKNGMESLAGYGSSLKYVIPIIEKLPTIFEEFTVKSVLDLPCGDYNWMKHVDKSFITYIGGDIVDEQISYNIENFADFDFRIIDMIHDSLPTVDLIFTRDCLMHLSERDIVQFFKNCIMSRSKYIMLSTCPDVDINKDLTGVIGWRSLNLEKPPL